MAKLTYEGMMNALSRYGEGIRYPVYITLVDMSSFLASGRNIHYGYMAVTDNNCIVIIDHNILGECGEYCIPIIGITSVKIKKGLFGSYTMKLQTVCDGKKLRLDITLPLKAARTDLNDQRENVEAIVRMLGQ